MAKLSTSSVFGDLLVDGTIFGNVTGNLTGNASTATSATTATTANTLTTARNIALGGVLSGSASFNGSANVTINASIAKPPKSGDWWSGGMPIVGTDGVMEVGKYIDFHNSDTSSNDYDVRLQSNTAGPILLTLPSSAGTLARTADNVASATKLQTIRTINGTNFDGTANITTANWGTARTITIGNTGKSVNGSGNVSWSTAEILGNQTVLGKDTDWNTANATGVYEASGFNESGATGANRPVGAYSWGGLLTLRHKNVTNQVYLSHGSNQMWIRGGWNGSFNTSWAQVYTTQFKPTYSDVGAAAASHGTHVTYSTSAPAANGTASAGSASNVSRGDHVHPLQTTVSGNAGSATKWQTARTLTIGNTGKSVDGTANVSWSLSEIGAAASSHTHNYAGSGSAGGAANSAVKLSSARTINGTNFDGSANITTANWGTSRKINQISVNGSADVKLPLDYYTCSIGSSNAKPYHHILTTGQCTGSYTDKSITIVLVNHYNNAGLGIAKATLRTNDAANGGTASGELRWLVRSGFAENALCFNIRNTAKDAYMDVFYKSGGTYAGLTWYVLTEGARGSHGSQWIKYNTHHDNGTAVYDEAGMKAIRTYTATLQSATDHGAVNSAKTAAACSGNAATATKLATARTLTIGNTGKAFDGSGNQSWSLAEIGAAATSHTHNQINSRGNVTCETGVTGRPAANGLSMSQAYNNGYPTTYGNVISLKGTGDGQILVGWSGTDGAHAPVYVRSKRDNTSTANWSEWAQFYTTANKPTYSDVGAAAASHGTHVTWATTAPKANGTAAVGSVARVAREDHIHPLQTSVSGNAGTATTLATARTLTIGATGKSFNGSANVSWSLSEIGAAAIADGVQTWNAVIKCATWSRILKHTGTTTVGGSYLINLKATRSNVVYNTTFIVNYSHSCKCFITQINNTDYSNIQVRAVVDSGNGSGYFEVYDNANSATNATTQTVYVTVLRLSKDTAFEKYTAFTDGTTIPSGYSEKSKFTTVAGSYYSGKAATAANATKLETARNINGTAFDGTANITTANWGTSRTITIGKTGKSVNGSGNVSWNMNEIMGAVSLSSSGTANKNKYIKFATVTLTNTWQCCSGKLALTNTEATASYGILHFYLRNGSAITTTSIELGWLTLNNSNYANRVYAVKVSDGKFDLYYRPYTDYETTRFTLLECNDPGLITLSAGSYTDSITAASTSSMKGVAASALKLTTARNIKIGNKSNSFDGSGNIEFTLADIGIGGTITAVNSDLTNVAINGFDSMMTTVNSNLNKLQ